MRRKLLSVGFWGWVLAGSAWAGSPATIPQTGAPVSARQTMHRLLKALEQRDLDTARGLSLRHQEFAEISRREVDRKDYHQRLDDFLRAVSEELSAGAVLEVTNTDALIVPPGDKLRHQVVMVVIHAAFRVKAHAEEEVPIPFVFILHQGAWRFFLRK